MTRAVSNPLATTTARTLLFTALAFTLALAGCGGSKAQGGGRQGEGAQAGHAQGMGSRQAQPEAAAVPVRVRPVERRPISRYLETNGVLEAESEVDVVARVAGPVTELLAEEGMSVRAGQLLARLDDRELANQLAQAKVARDEAQLAYDRARSSVEQKLIAQEAYDAASAALESAQAKLAAASLQLSYTRIEAPFDGVVVTRYVKLAQHVGTNSPLFRVSDFTPLLCPIQVPEKELANLRVGQRAHLELDAFPGRSFDASVLRISPTIDAATGTLKVTLEADGQSVLRPGLFASVYLETARHDGALVIPRTALVLDSIGDTVYVRKDGVAQRREVKLGFRESDDVEVLEGLSQGDEVVVLGQEGLSDGTPVTVLQESAEGAPGPAAAGGEGGEQAHPAAPGAPPSGAAQGARWSGMGGGGVPPQFAERLRNATPEELERIKERMRQRGLSDEEIEARLAAVRAAPKATPEPR